MDAYSNASTLEPAERFRLFLRAEMGKRFGPDRAQTALPTAQAMSAHVTQQGFPQEWAMRAVAVFCSHEEFRRHCEAQAVQADYMATRQAALREVRGLVAASTLAAPATLAVLDHGSRGRNVLPEWLDGLETIADLADLLGSLGDAFGSLGN